MLLNILLLQPQFLRSAQDEHLHADFIRNLLLLIFLSRKSFRIQEKD